MKKVTIFFGKCKNEQLFFCIPTKRKPPDFRDKNQAVLVCAYFIDFPVLIQKEINDYDNSLCQLAYDAVEEYRHLFGRLAVLAIQPFAYHRISALIEEKAQLVPFFLRKGFGNRHIKLLPNSGQVEQLG